MLRNFDSPTRDMSTRSDIWGVCHSITQVCSVLKHERIGARCVCIFVLDARNSWKSFGAQRTSIRRMFLTSMGGEYMTGVGAGAAVACGSVILGGVAFFFRGFFVLRPSLLRVGDAVARGVCLLSRRINSRRRRGLVRTRRFRRRVSTIVRLSS